MGGKCQPQANVMEKPIVMDLGNTTDKPNLRFHFSDSALKKVKSLPGRKQTDYWDLSRDAPAGFGIRITDAGTRSWQLALRVYGRKDGVWAWRSTRVLLGRADELGLAEAREKGRAVAAQAKEAQDVRRPAQRRQAEEKRRAEVAARESTQVHQFASVRAAFLEDCE